MKITISKYYIPSGRCIQSVEYDNGEPVDIPDDLRSKFKTRNGRVVLDGGGVSPDIKMIPEKDSPLLNALKEQHMIFKFVNEYVLGMDSLKTVDNFSFLDYEKFVDYLDKNAFSYETSTEKKLAELKKSLSAESMPEQLNQDVENLYTKVKDEKSRSISAEKVVIVEEIETEIVSRFFQQSGRVKFSLLKDPEVLRAVEVLNNPTEYKKLLGN
jgi:carboxyl-terminal processing protease